MGRKVSTRLLVPAAQGGSLIGKQGTTVKSIQEASSCIARVLGTEIMAELDQSFGEHDMSEIPENLQPEDENLQLEADNLQPGADNLQPEDDNLQPENDPQPEEKQVPNDKVVVVENKWPGWPGESVFRILVPTQKVGGIIGRKGEFIKKMCEEARARIKILNGLPGIAERAVMISAKEDPDSPLPPAVDGLLKVHKRIVEGLESDDSHAPPVMGGKVSTRLLAPAAQAGSLIGKQGTTVKSIQEASSCIVRVLGADDLPLFALQDDRIVEIVGEPSAVHKAVELIASHLRKFVVDRSIIPMFEMQMQMPNPQMEQHMPPAQSWSPPPQPLLQNAGGGRGYGCNRPGYGGNGPNYGGNQHYMPPPREHENYYPPAEMPPPVDKQPHHGISAYGREAPSNVHAPSNAQPAPSMITQVTQKVQIPFSSANAVIGTDGSSISYIRRASGATVTIQETRGVPGEMTVEISGTASQVQTAQQLIQNSMAEAAASTQTQAAPPADQGYNPYAPQYTSPPASAAQPGSYAQTGGYGQAAGGYGSVYGGNYSY